MPDVIVSNTKPNITSLPYVLQGKIAYFDFLPGKNVVPAKVMAAIVTEARGAMEYYRTFLKELDAAVDPDGRVNPEELSAADFIGLVDNTMDIGELAEYREIESAGKKRKTVLDAIAAQIEKIEAIEAKKER